MKREIPQLHAIRALAMAGIFLHHLYMGIGPLRQAQAGTLLDACFEDLALGVVVFNVLTSFLLAMPSMGDNPAPAPAYRDFVPRRLRRLCPLYVLSIVFVILGNAVVYRVTAPADWLPQAVSHLLFVDNLRLASFTSNTAAYWWLGLLMQFTLAFPLVLRFSRRFGIARLTWAVTLAAWPATEALKAWGRADPDGLGGAVAFLSTFNLPSRLPEFLIGMWMAEIVQRHPDRAAPVDGPLAWLIFGTCGLCAALFFVPGLPTPWFAGLAWTLAVLVGLYALPATAALGRRPWVLWISAASYGIYLVHQPILSYLDLAVASLPPWWRFGVLMVLAWLVSMREAQFLGTAQAWVTARIAPGR